MSKQDSESDINVDETQHQENSYTPETLDCSQNYAFILHLFALHFICITFAFHLHFA